MSTKPPRFNARHHGKSATYLARKIAGLEIGRVRTQSRFWASRSRPNPSVAKLTVHIGSRKVVKSEKTIHSEKTKNPLPSLTAARYADCAMLWIDDSGAPHGIMPV